MFIFSTKKFQFYPFSATKSFINQKLDRKRLKKIESGKSSHIYTGQEEREKRNRDKLGDADRKRERYRRKSRHKQK
jgi:hypothetical protein